MRTLKTVVGFLLTALLIGPIAILWDGNRMLNQPLRLDSGFTFEFARGENLQGAIQKLSGRSAFVYPRQELYLLLYGRFSGRAKRLRAGEYDLPTTLTPLSFLTLLESGKVRQYSFTVVEGWTAAELFRRLAAVPELKHELPSDPQAIMAALGEPDRHPEGLFYPDTYSFPRNLSDLEFLRRARAKMQTVLDEEWMARDPDLPLAAPYQALILASIIERETGAAEERPLIGGVFVRRLQKNMLLQTDPTVIYGMGERFDGNLRRVDLQADTPYNTYTRAGLPPTPIALPGRAAIRAALHPAPGDALYFVARGDGTHEFTATLEAHNAAVRRFQLGGSP